MYKTVDFRLKRLTRVIHLVLNKLCLMRFLNPQTPKLFVECSVSSEVPQIWWQPSPAEFLERPWGTKVQTNLSSRKRQVKAS